MTEKKKWSIKEWIFFVWFLIAIGQVNYSIFLMFFSNLGSFFLFNGLCMLGEGLIGVISVYGN